MAAPVLVVVHGAGSSPGVARAAFAGWSAAGWQVHSWWLRGHGPMPPPDPAEQPAAEDLADLAGEAAGATVVAGISYGAHLVARWAAGPHPGAGGRRLVLVMPAWTGAPGAVAAAMAAQAEAFETCGVMAELARVRAARPGWVSDALAESWPQHGPQLAPALRLLAMGAAPTLAELARIDVPVTVVALPDDPLHPLEVAREWAGAIPDAELVIARGRTLADLGDAALSGSR